MADLLYRLGRFSARRAWGVIAAWCAVLALAAGAFVLFGGTLSTTFSISGTESERVSDELAQEFPDVAGANASVVFTTDDGTFSAEQKQGISSLLSQVDEIDGVSGVVDPFETADELADQEQQLTDGEDDLEQAREDLEQGEEDWSTGKERLDEGQEQLDAAIEEARANGTYDAAAAQFEEQQTQIDDGRDELDTAREKLDDGKKELEDGEAQLTDGRALLDYSAGLRTVSSDEDTAAGSITFTEDMFSLPQDLKDEVTEALDAADIDGVGIDYSSTLTDDSSSVLGVGELIGVAVAALVLILMMRALLPTITPLLSSVLGLGVGIACSMAFSGAVEMSTVTVVLGVMVGLAVGIDYSLFIVNRHRKQVLSGMDLHESIGLANGTAGNAVVFAGSTVIVALAALGVTGVQFLGVMGIVAAACVLVAVLVSVTFTPALLGLMKNRVLRRGLRAKIGHPDHAEPAVRPMRTGRAVLQAVLAVGALVVIALPATDMRLALPDGSSEAADTTQYRAYKTVETEFGEGMNGPLIVVAETPSSVAEDDELATQVQIASKLMDQDSAAAVAPIATADDRTMFVFQLVPAEGPSSQSTEQLVHDLRAMPAIDGDITIGVAGQASSNIDVSEVLSDALPVYLAVVIGLSLLIMIVVFRSLLVPLIATGGYVLSLLAAFGAMTAIFQWGWLGDLFGVNEPSPIVSFAPIIIMGVLFGLAMDYQLFLVSGMREAYAHGRSPREAVVAGLRGGRAVVTAAAIIMVSVFSGFIFSHMAMIRPLGFGLAVGVLFDAFVVRMLLVPALMHLLGRSAWWLPRWLDRILPNVDVEGAALERKHPAAATTE